MNGLLIVDKPAGMTSHDVVREVRRRGRFGKVGHTGTLDPFATGVLPLCIGRATRLAGFLTLEDKGYDATLRLGVSTDTLDVEGKVLRCTPVDPQLPRSRIEEALARLRGPIRQTPPMYSAVKIRGKPLYRYAREGTELERPPRDVVVHELELVDVTLPEISIRVHCSKGTYVRVLAAGIGEALGVGAHLTRLCRTFTGPFNLADALSLEAAYRHLEAGTLEQVLIPMAEMMPAIPVLDVDDRLARRIRHGNAVLRRDLSDVPQAPPEKGMVRLCHSGELLAIGEVNEAASELENAPVIRPRTVLAVS